MSSQKTMTPPMTAPTATEHRTRGSSPIQNSNLAPVDRIRERAYQLYKMRINTHHAGDPMSDWLQAEEQIRVEFNGLSGVKS